MCLGINCHTISWMTTSQSQGVALSHCTGNNKITRRKVLKVAKVDEGGGEVCGESKGVFLGPENI